MVECSRESFIHTQIPEVNLSANNLNADTLIFEFCVYYNLYIVHPLCRTFLQVNTVCSIFNAHISLLPTKLY